MEESDQRILLARCLKHKPQIVILDEALAYLDKESRADLLDTLPSR